MMKSICSRVEVGRWDEWLVYMRTMRFFNFLKNFSIELITIMKAKETLMQWNITWLL